MADLDALRLQGFGNRTLGFVFQSFNAVAHDLIDNVALPLLYARIPRARARVNARRSNWKKWASANSVRAIPTSFPAASSSAPPSHVHWWRTAADPGR